LFNAIKALPENQRIAFTLHKVEGLSYQEVSEVMETTVSSVESLMHRAKTNLRKTLEKLLSRERLNRRFDHSITSNMEYEKEAGLGTKG
jgi:DNA-directed RNA polymerase specialized sigma24 family protein